MAEFDYSALRHGPYLVAMCFLIALPLLCAAFACADLVRQSSCEVASQLVRNRVKVDSLRGMFAMVVTPLVAIVKWLIALYLMLLASAALQVLTVYNVSYKMVFWNWVKIADEGVWTVLYGLYFPFDPQTWAGLASGRLMQNLMNQYVYSLLLAKDWDLPLLLILWTIRTTETVLAAAILVWAVVVPVQLLARLWRRTTA